MPTTWNKHKEQWRNCEECALCKTRKKVVLARGKLPCDVLFIGEAPGPAEDIIGQPFKGPAGHLLDSIITQAGYTLCDDVVTPPRLAFTNLTACIPRETAGSKFGEPPDWAVRACTPRLQQFVRLAKPRMIVCVGKHATKQVPKLLEGFNARKLTDLERERRAAAKIVERTGIGHKKSKAGATLVCGKPAEKTKGGSLPYVSIIHPAAILRMDISMKGLAIQQCVVTLSDALAQLSVHYGT